MKKILNIITGVVCVSLFILGVILVAVGLKKGGKLKFNIDYKNKTVTETRMDVTEDELKFDTFDDILVDVSVGNIKIVEGDEYAVKYRLIGETEVEVQDNALVVRNNDQSNTMLGISIGRDGVSLNFTDFFHGFESGDNYVEITVPKTSENAKFNIKTNVGNCHIEGMNVASLDVDGDVGRIELVGVTAKDCKIKNAVGNFEAKNSTFADLVANLSTGSVKLLDVKFNTATIDSDTGSINGNVLGDEKDYSCDFSTDTGKIKVDGKSVGQNYKSNTSTNMKAKISTDTGSINIQFK